MELITGENDNDRRLDRILRKALPDHPLPLLHRLIRQGKVFVNGKPAKVNDRLTKGVKINIPSLKKVEKQPPTARILPSPDILWQDSGLIAVYKPAGLAVHGPDSLDTMVRSFLAEKLSPSLSFRPGPLHRLDKPSSGIVIFCASLEGARLFSSLIQERNVRKIYLAIVEGNLENEKVWEDSLVRDKERKKTFVSQTSAGSKIAITKITPLAFKGGLSLIKAEIITGRTHQIRAQAAFHGYPLAGDIKYGGHGGEGIFLHAWKMEFIDISIEAPLPETFMDKIIDLFGNQNWFSNKSN
jgi:23S rRNA pseudouridine955/2504/2580 synthase